MEIRYTLPGRPTTWKRTNNVGRARVTSREMRLAKQAHAYACLAGMPPALRAAWSTNASAYELEVIAYLPDTRSLGDCDNYAKLVADALQGIAYDDDRSITDIIGRRRIDPERPRTEVTVRRLA